MPRAAQPAQLKLLKGRGNGTDSGGRKVAPAPAFKRLPPEAPEWLSDEARAEWDRVLPGLTRLDILKEEDRAALAAYCETWAEFVQATRALQEHGSLTITAAQGEIPHPAVAIRRNAGAQLRTWANQFGLTPSAEAALSTSKGGNDGDEDPFA